MNKVLILDGGRGVGGNEMIFGWWVGWLLSCMGIGKWHKSNG